MRKRLLVLPFLLLAHGAHAQATATVVGTCGTPLSVLSLGQSFPLMQDTTGHLCTNASGGGSNASVGATGSAVPGSATYIGASVSGTLTGLTASANGLLIDGSGVTQPVSVASLPLASNAATATNQTTGNTSLSTIATNSGNPIPTQATSVSIGGVSNDPCAYAAKSNFALASSSGNTQVVAGSSGKKVYICSEFIIGAVAWVGNLIEGTGAACTTANEAAVQGSTTATSGFSFGANGGFTLGNGGSTIAVTATAANGICVLQSGTAALAGNVTYVQQ